MGGGSSVKKTEPTLPENEPLIVSIGSGSIEVIKGNLTTVKTDVITIPSSSDLLKNAVFNAAGISVKNEYENKMKAHSSRKLIVLCPGSLPCKKLYIVPWQPTSDRHVLKTSVQQFIRQSIESATYYNCTSITYPAISCGDGICPIGILIRSIVGSIKNELLRGSAPLTVKIVVLPDRHNIFNAFRKEIFKLKTSLLAPIHFYLPRNWIQPQGSEVRFTVSANSPEFVSIHTDFHATMQGKYKHIVCIERIQNQHWYLQYMTHCDAFKKKLGADTEKRLYHGCGEEAANQIIQSWFNRAFAGRNGIRYGVGVYFSACAAISDNFALPNATHEKRIFIARVLIGKTTLGNSSMKVPPLGYDSTTDGQHIFVTYHDAQAYGEYLITYQ